MTNTLKQAKDLWLYDGIVADGYRLNDGAIEEDSTDVITKEQLFLSQAPMFNFELNADQLLAKALQSNFVKKVGNDKYKINNNY